MAVTFVSAKEAVIPNRLACRLTAGDASSGKTTSFCVATRIDAVINSIYIRNSIVITVLEDRA